MRETAMTGELTRAEPERKCSNGPLRVGVGGPVGSGKTALMEALCTVFRDRYDMCAITNDIYTKEDAQILLRAAALPDSRIMGVETGGCPHTAIKGGPGITRADLLVINKIDLAPLVGASLAVMESDTKRQRGNRPFVFANMKTREGLDTIAAFIERRGGLGV